MKIFLTANLYTVKYDSNCRNLSYQFYQFSRLKLKWWNRIYVRYKPVQTFDNQTYQNLWAKFWRCSSQSFLLFVTVEM